MRFGYVLGPLFLLPLLGAFFVVPQPEKDMAPRFTWAQVSLLKCHADAGDFLGLTSIDLVVFPSPGSPEPAAGNLR